MLKMEADLKARTNSLEMEGNFGEIVTEFLSLIGSFYSQLKSDVEKTAFRKAAVKMLVDDDSPVINFKDYVEATNAD